MLPRINPVVEKVSIELRYRGREIHEGGGESDLQNFQTLCVPCHAKKSHAQKERSKTEKRKKAAAGTADLRSFFKAPRV